MRRSHQEVQELIAARSEDYVNGHASEAVLKASLKALGLDADEIRYHAWRADVARTHLLKEQEAKWRRMRR
jgi:hypothetical protein